MKKKASIAVTIGTNIKYYRNKLNILEEDLALACHISLDYFRKIEYGEANISVDLLEDIARVLDIPVEKLLEENETY